MFPKNHAYSLSTRHTSGGWYLGNEVLSVVTYCNQARHVV